MSLGQLKGCFKHQGLAGSGLDSRLAIGVGKNLSCKMIEDICFVRAKNETADRLPLS